MHQHVHCHRESVRHERRQEHGIASAVDVLPEPKQPTGERKQHQDLAHQFRDPERRKQRVDAEQVIGQQNRTDHRSECEKPCGRRPTGHLGDPGGPCRGSCCDRPGDDAQLRNQSVVPLAAVDIGRVEKQFAEVAVRDDCSKHAEPAEPDDEQRHENLQLRPPGKALPAVTSAHRVGSRVG